MNSPYHTLTQAYMLIDQIRRPYPAEVSIILSMFVSPDRIEALGDHDLYLAFLKTVLDQRENVSLPDKAEAFDQYFEDCLSLKKLMEDISRESGKASSISTEGKEAPLSTDGEEAFLFPEENWLSSCVRLLENLKTPYYSVYAGVLFDLTYCFPASPLFDQTLQAFYSVLIRSGENVLPLIRLIASHGRLCRQKGWLDGQLLSDLLIHQLSIYADGKNLWIPGLARLLHMEDCRDPETLLMALLRAQNRYMTQGYTAQEYMAQEYMAQEYTAQEYMAQADSPESGLALWLSSFERWMRSPEETTTGKEGAPARDVSLDSKTSPDGKTSLDGKASLDEGDLWAKNMAGSRIYTGTSNNSQIDSIFLNTFAYNMNARSYITNPAIGRDQELKDLELILISPKKSPILIGESGVGKTSVVEGLAWLLSRGEVPPLLKNKTIFKLTTTSLLSGTKYVGEMEDRIKQLTAELAKYPDVILFIDEIHTIVGAGSTESSHNDISNMLKPFIDRGDIKIIGATTIQEYEAYMLPDRALARRFYPIGIDEPDPELTLRILLGTIPSIEEETRVRNPFDEEESSRLLKILIQLSDRKNQPPGRITRLPELPLSILEMAFSYAALNSRKDLSLQDLVLAVRHTNLLTREVRMKAEDYWIN